MSQEVFQEMSSPRCASLDPGRRVIASLLLLLPAQTLLVGAVALLGAESAEIGQLRLRYWKSLEEGYCTDERRAPGLRYTTRVVVVPAQYPGSTRTTPHPGYTQHGRRHPVCTGGSAGVAA